MKTRTVKIASIVLALAMMLSIFTVFGTVSAGAAAKNRVSLYCASPTFSKYGMTSYEVYIQTKDDCKDQKVYVHYNYMNNEKWRDQEAELYKVMNDGSKIWKANFTSYNTRYCIKYVANGVTYWDNNNGKDYTYGTSIGSNNAITSERYGYQYNDWYKGFEIGAVLQNYGYHKNVFVRYTTDGWKSHHDQALSYKTTNNDGTETWKTEVTLSNADAHSENFRYAICYQVNGKEYWANNFGENYDRNYYIYR
jgi:hypothetical protein